MVMTLVLVVTLATVVVAISSYAATGLRSSRVTDSRMERIATAEAGVWWAAQEVVRHGDCDLVNDGVPPELEINGEGISVSCRSVESDFELVGNVLNFQQSTSVAVRIQVVPGIGSYQVLEYRIRD